VFSDSTQAAQAKVSLLNRVIAYSPV